MLLKPTQVASAEAVQMEVKDLLVCISPSVGDQAKPGLGYPLLAGQFGRDGE
jgi:hypothetical protein